MIKWREPEVKQIYPLTHPQKRIWYTEQINPGTGLFNIMGMLRIKGKINPEIMKKSVKLVIERNDAARLRIINEDGEPKQYVQDIEAIEMPFIDFSHEAEQIDIQQWIKEKTAELMPEGELIQCFLVKLAEDDYYYLHKCNHIICDGWTFSIFKHELDVCYRHLCHGDELPEPPSSYLEFISDEESYKSSSRFQKHRDFWLENFQDIPKAVTISPQIHSSKGLEGRRYKVQLDKKLTREIIQYVEDNSSSIYSFFMALLFTYMYRVTGLEDIIIGTPVLNRGNARQKNTVGMFVSTMPFRVQIENQSTFADFLKLIMAEQRSYYRAQRYPMDVLVKDLGLSKKGNHKLFEISLSYQNAVYEQTFAGYPTVLEWIFNGYEENSLTIHINDRNELEELIIEYDYATDAFTVEQIELINQHMLNMARKVIANPETPLWKIEYLEDTDLEEMLYGWNQTTVEYPGHEKVITQLIEEQVRKNPEKVAVTYKGKELTYLELNNLANQLARTLQNKGVGPERLVGLLVERSEEALVGILAVLKAGGAYVPIDPEYPEERIHYMLEDSDCKVLLTQSIFTNSSEEQTKVPTEYSGEVICLDQYLAAPEGETTNLNQTASPQNLAYVIYTSGSTGKPKGVMIEHRGLTNYIWWAKDYYCPDTESNFALYSSLSFDLTVTSIFVPLVKGSTITIMGNEKGNLVSEVIKQENVNIVKLTPAHLSLIKDQDNTNSSVRKFILGGEDLKANLARAAIDSFGGNLEIYNEYGPTETVVGCIIHKFEPAEPYSSVLIGKPIANTQIYLLDKYLQPVAPGAIGEIYISGDGVARGYLNQPELSAEKFINNPFIPGKRMYRSGDLGRYLHDGRMECLGRVDTQVKIRGYRVEVGEIEAAFLQHPDIKEGIIDVRIDDTDSKYLVGYFVSDKDLTIGDLRAHLLAKLPDYMVPLAFVKLDAIPLTTNGKIDRKALPEPTSNVATGVDYKAPETEMEDVIAEVWAEVLGLSQVGVHDNFFELGGDSIKAIQVSTRLKNRGIECKVQDIFTYHTVSQVALHATRDVKEIKAEQGIVEGEIIFTPILNWFFDLNLQNPDFYNQSVLLSLDSQIELSRLEQAFKYLLSQHDALRLNYNMESNKLYHENEYLSRDFTIPVIDLSELDINLQQEELRRKAEDIKTSLKLSDGLLMKAAIFDLGTAGRKLLITIHHLVVDGVSWRILLEDLAANYLQLVEKSEVSLPLKTTSFKEWAEALAEYAQTEKAAKDTGYWEEILDRIKPIKVDNPGTGYGLIADTEVSKVNLDADKTSALLTKANEAYNTNTNDLLLTALAITIGDWLKEREVSIWLEGHGREELFPQFDLSRTVGWFTTIYPNVLELTDNSELSNQIKSIKEQNRKIPGKGIGYGILKYLTKKPFKQSSDLVGIVFNYLGQFDQELQTELFSFSDWSIGAEIGQVNQRTNLLEFNCMVINGCLEIQLNYSSQRYDAETIQKILDQYLSNLCAIIDYCTEGEHYGFTPSDFDTVELSQEDLDALFG